MAVNFYDVNFNQYPDGGTFSSIPAISGYIIDDEGFENRIMYEGKINDSNIISTATTTNNIQGAVSMDRFRITTETGEIVTCRLLPDGDNCIGTIINDETAQVYICDSSGIVIESLSIPYNENCLNISFIGHFNSNDEIDWISIACQDLESSMTIINTTGFSSTVFNLLKDYIYLKYKYKYQVEIQETLRGTSEFQVSRFPANWYDDFDVYNDPDNRTYSTVVLPCDNNSDVPDLNSAFGWSGTFDFRWYNGIGAGEIALKMATYLSDTGFSFGSDIFRINANGTFTNGVDLNQSNRITFNPSNPYDISFEGGYIRVWEDQYSRKHVAILDSEKNQIDDVILVYPINSALYPGDTNPLYSQDICCYIAKNNTKYYLVALRQFYAIYDGEGNRIQYTGTDSHNYGMACCYQILKKFNDEASNLLFKATNQEKIVPADPDNLTADEVENQTTDSDVKNEFGEEIPVPKYSEGEWSDESTDGVRGSGRGVPTGENSESKLDRQPDLPALPSIPSAVSTGFIKLYNPTDSEISSLGQELTSDSVLNILNKFFGNNPLDFIVGLQVVPGNFSIDESMKYHINYGSYNSSVGMYKITNENCVINYGTLELKEIYGSWEDYNPHTRMMIYLPYIGIRDIDPDRIQGTRLNLKYYVNAITGSILAVLTSTRVDSNNKGAELLVGQWSGQASYTIPLTNTQHNSAVNAVIGVVSAGIGIGAGIATGGLSVPATVGLAGNALLSGAKATKTDLTMQGGVSGSLSFFTGHDAYIQIEYPKEGRPKKYDHIIGKPSNLTTDIKHQPLNNYIEFVEIDVTNVSAPNEEKQMIVNMLKGGIYT